jgi:diguanylate cyclase (GGDEF)-like protein
VLQLRDVLPHDPLTDLPNRQFLLDRLRHVLAQSARYPDRLFAVLYLELDHFRVLNETIGDIFGDGVLREVSRRLQRCVRSVDTVARFGEDEFVILLNEIREPMEAVYIVERIQEKLAQRIELFGCETLSTAAIGIALGSVRYENPEEIVRDAETAMKRAQRQGPGRCAMFDATMQEQVEQRLLLEAELENAIVKNEFRLHYQPIVSLETQKIEGFEALVRWQSPRRGLLYPADFLQLAEAIDLLVPITNWVLRESCGCLAKWQAKFPPAQTLYVSVNLPKQYLENQALGKEISSMLSEKGLEPSHLTVEITENQCMEHPQSVADMLRALSTTGVRSALDDFGKDYSSLSYLANLPVQILKIDQSFTAKLDNCERSEAIVRAILSLGECLGLDVIAEGVESAEQMRRLQLLGCKHAQGFYFAKPLEMDLAERFLAQTGICGSDCPSGRREQPGV